MNDLDLWSRDEWWRAQNPGASCCRGVAYMLVFNAIAWLIIAGAIWAIW